MPLFSKSTPETTGHDLLAAQQEAAETYLETLKSIQADAADRAPVVEARLQELEAEKAILNSLGAVKLVQAEVDPDEIPF